MESQRYENLTTPCESKLTASQSLLQDSLPLVEEVEFPSTPPNKLPSLPSLNAPRKPKRHIEWDFERDSEVTRALNFN
jgi:hypothetical protein